MLGTGPKVHLFAFAFWFADRRLPVVLPAMGKE